MRCRRPPCTPWGSRPATAGGRPPPSRWWPTGRPSTACSASSAAPAAAPTGPATAGCWSAAAPLASIGGNVAHAQPNLVAQAIAAAIPLAVLAMLEGLKGDAGEVTRLTAQAADPDHATALDRPGQLPQATTVRRTDPTALPDNAARGGRLPAASAARRAQPDRPQHGRGAAAGGLCPAAAGRPTLDGPHPGRGRRLWPQQRRQLPATPAPTGCGAHPMSRPSWQLRDAAAWLCLPRHPGAAPALPPPPPPRPPARHRRRHSRTLRWGRAARVGIRAAASPPSTPWAAWSPTGSRTPPTNRARVLAWWTRHPQANIGLATGHRFDVLDVDGPAGAQAIRDAGRRPWPAQLGAAGPDRRGRLALLPGPHRPRQRPSPRPRACGLAGPGRLCGRPTQPPRLRPPLPVGRRPRPGHPTWPRCPRCCWSGCSPASASDRPGPVQLPAVGDGPGDRYARAALAQELARVATAPVGQRNRQLWESTRNLYNLVATGALDHREVDQGLLAGRRTLRAARRGAPPDPPHPGLGPPGRPGPPRPPTPAHQPRTHPCLATPACSSGRRANQGGEVRAMAAAGQPAG